MGLLQADKHAITQQLGVQLRDLRLLDPQLHFLLPVRAAVPGHQLPAFCQFIGDLILA